jgi:hypothetical protein
MRNTAGILVLSVAIPLVLNLALAPPSFARGGGSASHSSSGMGSMVGLANPSRSLLTGTGPANPGVNLMQAPVPGTSGSPAADSALHANAARASGAGPDRDIDARIDAENRRLDRSVDSICKGC